MKGCTSERLAEHVKMSLGIFYKQWTKMLPSSKPHANQVLLLFVFTNMKPKMV